MTTGAASMTFIVCLSLHAAEEAPVAGRPATFTGWVGQFRIEASAAAHEVRFGQGVEVQIQIRGRGRSGQPPQIQSDPRFTERFDVTGPLEEPRTDEHDGESSWTYAYSLAPKSPDVDRIPPVRWSYYDDAAGRFQTVLTAAIPLEVSVSDKVKADDVQPATSPEEHLPYAWFVLIGLVGLTLLALLVRSIRWLPAPPATTSSPPRKSAPGCFRRADAIERLLSAPPPTTREALAQATKQFRTILAATLDLPLDSATSRELLSLATQKFSPDSCVSLRELLDGLDRAQYGPVPDSTSLANLHRRMIAWLQSHARELSD